MAITWDVITVDTTTPIAKVGLTSALRSFTTIARVERLDGGGVFALEIIMIGLVQATSSAELFRIGSALWDSAVQWGAEFRVQPTIAVTHLSACGSPRVIKTALHAYFGDVFDWDSL